MARHLRPCLALLSVLALAGACKVSASTSTSSADDARPDSGGSTAKPDSGGGGGEKGGGGDSQMGLSSVPAEPGEPEATDPSGSISAGKGAGCADAGHAPGDSWKDDCNTCNCTDAGEVVCTRMHCGDDDSAPH